MTAKAALIIAVALIVCTGLYIYFSPYQVCMRAENSGHEKTSEVRTGMPAHIRCLALLK